MSSVAATRPLPAPARASVHAERDDRATLALRLAVFALFAFYGAVHWAMLVAAPPVLASAGVALTATACGAALALLDRSALSPRVVLPSAVIVVLLALAAGCAAVGIAPRLVWPSGWGELADRIDSALVGVQSVDWAYDGPDEWIRRTILLGAPLLLTTAAAVAFWPAPPAARPPMRAAATIALIATYAIAVTTNSPGRPLLFGTLLLALIGAWLWLPRLRGRERAIGAAVVAAAAVLALPAAAALDGERPWFDYRSWSFGDDAGIAFDWSHRYGPLDWPRQGATLLSIRSEEPHYWKAEALDGFDGVRWHRSANDDVHQIDAELPFPSGSFVEPGVWDYGEPNPEWNHQIHVTVRALTTDLLVGAGLTHDVRNVAALPSADGTTELLGDPLERGDEYTITAYEPTPDASQLTGAPKRYPVWASRYTELVVPAGDGPASSASLRRVAVPLRDSGAAEPVRTAAERVLADSAYGRTYALASRLTVGSATTYEAVDAIETHLRDSYAYSEQVPEHAYPLESFLFDDRRGYCQQFSGAMALMLRMVGIPARVAAGFSPGTLNTRTGEYRVRDLDAHSWVEVYFPGIGWVPFDPTPAVADAASQTAGGLGSGGDGREAGTVRQDSSGAGDAPGRPNQPNVHDGTSTGGSGSGAGAGPSTALALLAAGLAAIGLAGALAFALRVRRRRALAQGDLAAAEVAELEHALERLGWELPPSTTLLGIERRLAATAGPVAADYARALRSYRFDPGAGRPPGPIERRALRRALGSGRGPLGHLRAVLALPPGGPAASYKTDM